MEHLTTKEINPFIEGHLDRKERERILEHLDHCPMCVKWLADVVRGLCRLQVRSASSYSPLPLSRYISLGKNRFGYRPDDSS